MSSSHSATGTSREQGILSSLHRSCMFLRAILYLCDSVISLPATGFGSTSNCGSRPGNEALRFVAFFNPAFINPIEPSTNLEISSSGTHLKNRHKQSLQRMGKRPISSSGRSDKDGCEVLIRDRPQRGQYIRLGVLFSSCRALRKNPRLLVLEMRPMGNWFEGRNSIVRRRGKEESSRTSETHTDHLSSNVLPSSQAARTRLPI